MEPHIQTMDLKGKEGRGKRKEKSYQLSEVKGVRIFLPATPGGGFAIAFIRRVGKPALR